MLTVKYGFFLTLHGTKQRNTNLLQNQMYMDWWFLWTSEPVMQPFIMSGYFTTNSYCRVVIYLMITFYINI